MRYRDTQRRLAELEATDKRAAAAAFTDLLDTLTDAEFDAYLESIGGVDPELEAMSDEELERLAASGPAAWPDVHRLREWLEVHRASS